MKKIQRALISVSDKTNLIKLASALIKHDIEIISTGGTALQLNENQIPHKEIFEITDFPEIMGGRVKTLHPRIHGGILHRGKIDATTMEQYDIKPIDLVIVNLYPFEATIQSEDTTFEKAIENIDIGGSTLLRGAAKNHNEVAVLCNPQDYHTFITHLNNHHGMTSPDYRKTLATKAFRYTAFYDATIAQYLTISDDHNNHFPNQLSLPFHKVMDMRYGENPHQKAALYADTHSQFSGITHAKQHNGKTLSYNNIQDADAAWALVSEFKKPSCVIVKHANPCGAASAHSLLEAYENAFKSDSMSAFGGIIAFNGSLDELTAQKILQSQFVEVIIATDITPEALRLIKEKKNIRLLTAILIQHNHETFDFKRIQGGMLIQSLDTDSLDIENCVIATTRQPSNSDMDDLKFAWKVVKHVKSNAIVYCKNEMTLGIGAGQMSRIFSAKIAEEKAQNANLSLKGAIMASDAFFPFRDAIDAAAKAGIQHIIQPGGSIKDPEIIEAANAHNLCMLLTGTRHFKH